MALSLILRVGSTSAQDIALTSSGVIVTGYAMSSPDVDQTALTSLGDGNGLSVPAWSNVTESIELHISGATALLVSDKIRAIEKLLDLARQGTTGYLDDKLYLRAQFDHDTEPWRSQILAAKLQMDAVTDHIWRKYVTATIFLTRRYYWETEAERSVSMTSGVTTTATTSGVTVYNNDDVHATQQNWFQVAAAEVVGSIPAPVKMTVTNSSGATRQARAFYFGNYVYENATTVDPIFRLETTVAWIGTLGTTAYAISLASGNLLSAFKGQFGRVLAVFTSMPQPTTLLRAGLQLRFPSPEIDIALGEHVLASGRVVDLGTLPLPPGTWSGEGNLLFITIEGNAVDGDSMNIDWVQVMPSGAGRYRVLKGLAASYGLNNGDKMVDDGMAGTAYSIEGGTVIPAYRPFFEPINLWPGKINRIRMIVAGGTTNEPGQPWTVSMNYRPRRLTA